MEALSAPSRTIWVVRVDDDLYVRSVNGRTSDWFRGTQRRHQGRIRHTDAPVELTVEAGDDMVRIEVRDHDASLPGNGRVVSFELREASTAV
jgi:hypothetical protein